MHTLTSNDAATLILNDRQHAGQVTAAVARLLWEHRLTADLRRRLDGDSVLEAAS